MELVTPRLRIREFMETDFQAFREMESRPDMHTYEKEFPREAETLRTWDCVI
jgi:RimJ/RimL family protein N-acetyltransferase